MGERNLGLPLCQHKGQTCLRMRQPWGRADERGKRVSVHTQPDLASQAKPSASQVHGPINVLFCLTSLLLFYHLQPKGF